MFSWILKIAPFVVLVSIAGCLNGCAWLNASNATRVAEAVAKGPSEITYARMPLDPLTEDPELAGRDIWIPSIPLKDVDVELFYPDGSTRLKATAKASPFVAAVMAGTLSLDAAKFAHDQWVITMVDNRIASLESKLMPLALNAANAALARYEAKTAAPPAVDAPGVKDKLAALIEEILRSKLAEAGAAKAALPAGQ